MTNKQIDYYLSTGYFAIIRFSQKSSPSTVALVRTLEEAQTICCDSQTAGSGWFCGYSSQRYGSAPRAYTNLQRYLSRSYICTIC